MVKELNQKDTSKKSKNNSKEKELHKAEFCESFYQINPIERKLLDFSLSNKTDKFSVRDLFSRK